jgi:transposase-like protein
MKKLMQNTVQEGAGSGEGRGAVRGQGRAQHRAPGPPQRLLRAKADTRIGKLELRVSQDCGRRFRTEVFARYQRSEKALLPALAEMYEKGGSTRKVRAVTEALCGHAFGASSASAITVQLDEELERFARRPLTEEYHCQVAGRAA